MAIRNAPIRARRSGLGRDTNVAKLSQLSIEVIRFSIVPASLASSWRGSPVQ
jgi:hypothetical protein